MNVSVAQGLVMQYASYLDFLIGVKVDTCGTGAWYQKRF